MGLERVEPAPGLVEWSRSPTEGTDACCCENLFPECILRNLKEASVPAWPLKERVERVEPEETEEKSLCGRLQTLHKMLHF